MAGGSGARRRAQEITEVEERVADYQTGTTYQVLYEEGGLVETPNDPEDCSSWASDLSTNLQVKCPAAFTHFLLTPNGTLTHSDGGTCCKFMDKANGDFCSAVLLSGDTLFVRKFYAPILLSCGIPVQAGDGAMDLEPPLVNSHLLVEQLVTVTAVTLAKPLAAVLGTSKGVDISYGLDVTELQSGEQYSLGPTAHNRFRIRAEARTTLTITARYFFTSAEHVYEPPWSGQSKTFGVVSLSTLMPMTSVHFASVSFDGVYRDPKLAEKIETARVSRVMESGASVEVMVLECARCNTSTSGTSSPNQGAVNLTQWQLQGKGSKVREGSPVCLYYLGGEDVPPSEVYDVDVLSGVDASEFFAIAFDSALKDVGTDTPSVYAFVLDLPRGVGGSARTPLWLDSEALGAWRSYLFLDVLPWSQVVYGCSTGRDQRGVFGHSSGGMGALYNALARPPLDISPSFSSSFRVAASLGGWSSLPRAVKSLQSMPVSNYSSEMLDAVRLAHGADSIAELTDELMGQHDPEVQMGNKDLRISDTYLYLDQYIDVVQSKAEEKLVSKAGEFNRGEGTGSFTESCLRRAYKSYARDPTSPQKNGVMTKNSIDFIDFSVARGMPVVLVDPYASSPVSTSADLRERMQRSIEFGLHIFLQPQMASGEGFVPDENLHVSVFWGILGIKRNPAYATNPVDTDKGEAVIDPNFDVTDPYTQSYIVEVCDAFLKGGSLGYLNAGPDVQCVLVAFREWLAEKYQMYTFPVPRKYFTASYLDTFLKAQKDYVGTIGFNQDASSSRVVSWVRIMILSDVSEGTDPAVAEERYLAWERAVDQINSPSDCPRSMSCKAKQTSQAWVKMEIQLEAVRGTIQAIAVSTLTALLATLLFAGDIRVALFTAFNLMGVVVSLIGGFFYLGYQLGPIEMVSLTVVVGVAVDYCMHITEAFSHSTSSTSLMRVVDAVRAIGDATMGSALTTALSCVPLMFCKILILDQFGKILSLNTLLSIVFAMFFFAPLLGTFGPDRIPKDGFIFLLFGSMLRIAATTCGLAAVVLGILYLDSMRYSSKGLYPEFMTFEFILTVCLALLGGTVLFSALEAVFGATPEYAPTDKDGMDDAKDASAGSVAEGPFAAEAEAPAEALVVDVSRPVTPTDGDTLSDVNPTTPLFVRHSSLSTDPAP